MGHLTRDPELRYTPKGTAVAELGLALNRTWTNEAGEKQEEVTFVTCVAYGRTAELAAEYLKKGRPVLIEGRLRQESWDDKQTGQKRYAMKVVIESMQFLGTTRSEDGPAPPARTAQRGSAPSTARRTAPQGQAQDDAPEDDDDSQIPF